VVGLDYHDPLFDPHVAFNRFKRHPLIARLLDGGRLVRYGAKALPEGGWNTVPRVHADGALIAGDAGGFVNSVRLKGIHLAMRTGMLAAETAFEALQRGDTSAARLASYQHAIDGSAVRRELEPVRNVHQAFGHGLVPGCSSRARRCSRAGLARRPARRPGTPACARCAGTTASTWRARQRAAACRRIACSPSTR
jgi:electron-transferring-flavoprotein dehydrogenase